MHFRTCNKCQKETESEKPPGKDLNSFLSRKCPHCKNGSLDWGSSAKRSSLSEKVDAATREYMQRGSE